MGKMGKRDRERILARKFITTRAGPPADTMPENIRVLFAMSKGDEGITDITRRHISPGQFRQYLTLFLAGELIKIEYKANDEIITLTEKGKDLLRQYKLIDQDVKVTKPKEDMKIIPVNPKSFTEMVFRADNVPPFFFNWQYWIALAMCFIPWFVYRYVWPRQRYFYLKETKDNGNQEKDNQTHAT